MPPPVDWLRYFSLLYDFLLLKNKLDFDVALQTKGFVGPALNFHAQSRLSSNGPVLTGSRSGEFFVLMGFRSNGIVWVSRNISSTVLCGCHAIIFPL